MTKTFRKVQINNDGYYKASCKRDFKALGSLSEAEIKICFDFSYEMAFGSVGEHRQYRSGGLIKRKPGEIFINTFQGKIAEFAIYRYLADNRIVVTKPDLSISGKGVWDSFDFKYLDLHIAVKSTKKYGNLLLLESKDWNEAGEYIPGNGHEKVIYNAFVLLRLEPNGDELMRKKRILYSLSIERDYLYDTVARQSWQYDIAGFITNKDLLYLIKNEFILPQGVKLNEAVRMDADNYYVQTGDMRTASELINGLRDYASRKKNSCSKNV